jgi:DNA-binding NarL/FixJ family response regulator
MDASPSPSCRILVVDDCKPYRRFICLTLQERSKFQVVGEAADGLEGLQRAEELKPDLILLDIGLPRLNGIKACRLIRERVPTSKIVFLTLQSDAEVVSAALDAGALGYVHKARAARELNSAVEAALAGKQFVSSNLKVPVFDIFSGTADKDAAWVETVAGLSSARGRMEAIAAEKPGHYFVFSRRDHSILALSGIDAKQESAPKQKTEVA